MELLVAILIIAVLAAVAFAVVRHRRAAAVPLGGTHGSPLRARRAGTRGDHPMAAAVQEHAQAVDPHDVVVAEQRLQARAGEVAAGLHATAHRSAAAEHLRAAEQYGADAGAGASHAAGYDPASSANYEDPHRDGSIDPATGQRVDGYGDPENDPRYGDPRYDGRLAADYDPQPDDRRS